MVIVVVVVVRVIGRAILLLLHNIVCSVVHPMSRTTYCTSGRESDITRFKTHNEAQLTAVSRLNYNFSFRFALFFPFAPISLLLTLSHPDSFIFSFEIFIFVNF